ncbi:MAG: hypothetical protein QM790_15020 [Nibricoccus sp.]
MKNAVRHVVGCALVMFLLLGRVSAGSSNWTDLEGTTFKGEPRGSFGPFALFRTGPGKGRRVLFRTLSPEDCVRFYQETAGKPPRAADGSKSRSSFTFDLLDKTSVLQGDALAPASFKGKPEPELYVLLFASSWEGASYKIPGVFRPTYDRLRRLYGDDVEMVFVGLRQDAKGDLTFAKGANFPGLVVDYDSRGSVELFKYFAPAEGYAMALVTRDGIPLAVADAGSVEGIKKFTDEVCSIMAAGDELNSAFWKDRAYYLSAVRPVQFAAASAPALLIGNPLRPSILRKNNVAKLAAKLEIDARGVVTAATLFNAAELKPNIAAALEKALKSSFVFVPAIDHGKPVPSSYDFNYTVPDEVQAKEADRDWILLSSRKEVTLPGWLVLRPISVPAEAFGGGAAAGGTTAYSTDFFAKDGPGALQPANGQPVVIDGKTLKWEGVETKDGVLNFLGKESADNCVGYAWTQFESPAAGPAYLGFGSTDGFKVWVNGTLVLDRWWMQSLQIDQEVVPISLAAGKNTVLVKSQNQKEDWSFILRIRR